MKRRSDEAEKCRSEERNKDSKINPASVCGLIIEAKLNSCKKENKSERKKKKKKKKGSNSVFRNQIVEEEYVRPCTTEGSLVDNEVVPEVSTHKNLMDIKAKEASEAILVIKK